MRLLQKAIRAGKMQKSLNIGGEIMCRKSFFLLFILIAIHIFSSQLYAQKTEHDTIKTDRKVGSSAGIPQESIKIPDWEPTTSLYFELLGKGIYSINVDFRKTKTRAFGIGIEYFENAFLPSLMFYHFGGKKFTFETGGGLSVVIDQTDGLKGMGIHGVIGYRYQVKKGVLFRIGFTPLIGIPFTDSGNFVVVPLIGISYGYSF